MAASIQPVRNPRALYTHLLRWIAEARQDAVHGLRLLRRSAAFTATAILSLAIGIGADTAIFTVANGLLLRSPAGIIEARSPSASDKCSPVSSTAYLPSIFQLWLERSRCL
ncbi:MAG: hypothetical protein ABIW19_09915 [Vicinamibacterales bacterium]